VENPVTLPQKVVDRKTIVLKSRIDSHEARLLGERKKTGLFKKRGFLKPRPIDISLVSFNRYYEPFVVIGGKYSVDYCRRRVFEFTTENQVQEIFIGSEEFKLEPLNSQNLCGVVKVAGEEHSHYESETYFIADRLLRECSPEKVSFAPFEDKSENPENSLSDFRKVNITLEEEIEFLRNRIVKRPANAEVIIREIFEINERMVIYAPVYELVFQNNRTAEERILLIDGVTSKLTILKFDPAYSKKLVSTENLLLQDFQKTKPEAFQKSLKDLNTKSCPNSKDDEANTPEIENVDLEKETKATQVFESEQKFEAECAISLATNFLKRLGFKDKLSPSKVSLDGELFVVELNLHDRTAKVGVNTKTKVIKEYEIQESARLY
jgi:hypothetical protein